MKKLFKVVAGILVFAFWESRHNAVSKIHNYYASNVSATVGGKILNSERRGSSKSSAHDIEYQYVVNGYTFVSDTVSYKASGSNYSRRTVRKYPVGKEVTVYYDPSNPRYSVLELGELEARVFLQAIFGAIFALCVAFWPAAKPRS